MNITAGHFENLLLIYVTYNKLDIIKYVADMKRYYEMLSLNGRWIKYPGNIFLKLKINLIDELDKL